MPRISIIIPFYNAEKYIERCLDSVLAQTFTDFEVICVDDGSKDNTYQILQNYAKKDDRIKAYIQENGGPSAARRNALSKATGKYLMFCDSDDWFEPNMCQTLFEAIEQNDVDVVCCNAQVSDEKDNIQRTDHLEYYINKQNGIHQISNEIIQKTNVLLWNKIWKKSLVDQYQVDFPPCREYDDSCFFMQYMSVAKKIMYLDDKLYNYFRRQDSVMGKVAQKKDKTYFDKLYTAKFYFDFLEKHNLFLQNKNSFFYYLCEIHHFGCLRWKEKDWLQAKHIFNELFPEKIGLQNFIFYKKIKFCCGIELQILNILKESHIYRKYVVQIGKLKLKFKCRIKKEIWI